MVLHFSMQVFLLSFTGYFFVPFFEKVFNLCFFFFRKTSFVANHYFFYTNVKQQA